MGKRRQAPTFLLELPLLVTEGQAKHLRAHLEAGRQCYNAVLSEGQRRMRQMRADPAWKAARAIPRSRKPERAAAFSRLREQYGFSEYALHQTATALRASWIAEHLDAVLAQTLATRAYHALNRVCVGKARRVRFKSRGRGLSSIENKRNDTGLRFVLQSPQEGNQGFLLWKGDALGALIDWNDPVVKHGLAHRIKYARLIKRCASSQRAAGADSQGNRYSVQLALEGVPYHKPKHPVGSDTIGLDLGPSSVAVVPREGEASLAVFCEELQPDAKAIRRLQRKMDRKLRAGNPEHYDEQGRIKKRGKAVKKPLSQRWHTCPCGVGPVQRDLYSVFLAAYLDPVDPIPSCAQYVIPWEGAGVGGEARLRAAHERVHQRATEGHSLPRSFGCARESRSASAWKSKRTHTRAFFPPLTRQVGSVDGTLEPPVF